MNKNSFYVVTSFFKNILFFGAAVSLFIFVQGCAVINSDKPASYKDNAYQFPLTGFNVLVDMFQMNGFDVPPSPMLKIDVVSNAVTKAFQEVVLEHSNGGEVSQINVTSRGLNSRKQTSDSIEYNQEFYKKVSSFRNKNYPLVHLTIDGAQVVNGLALTGNISWKISISDVNFKDDVLVTKNIWTFKSGFSDFSWNGCGFFFYKPCSRDFANGLISKLKKDNIIR